MTINRAQPNALKMFSDRLDPPKSPFADDPAGWVGHRLREHITVKQKEILDSVIDHKHTAVHSSNSIGKSFSMARLAAWWIEIHGPGEAFVVTTAPTWHQVESILWKELARAHRKGMLSGKILGDCEWKINMGPGPDELVAYGRKPADYDAGSFLGIHARYVLVIIDEACGVSQGIYDAAESLATNDLARIVAVGNPDDPSSYFEKICQPASGWNVIHADALRSPNFTAAEVNKYPAVRSMMIREGISPSTEEIPRDIRDLLVTPSWANDRIKRWGPNSPLFTSRVRGQFPTVTNNTLIHPHWVVLACAREIKPADVDPWMGVDVARYGTDHSIIVLRLGGNLRVVKDIAYGPITELAGEVQMIGNGRINTPIANVDDTGVGGGVTDILMQENYPCHGLNSSAACSADEVLTTGKPKFFNARSEWWWRMREWLAGYSGTGEDGRLDLDPEDEELIAQLTSVRYKINSHGQIQVESKDEMRARHLDSPDRGDAAIYSLVPSKGPNQMMPNLDLMITGDLLTKAM
jgi:hypothetical protein